MSERERFLDRVLNFMGIQEDDDDEQAATDEEQVKTAVRPDADETGGRKGRLVSFPGRESGLRDRSVASAQSLAAVSTGVPRWRMAILEPQSYDDVQAICDHLKERRPVIVSVEGLDKELSKRIIDFVSGTTYAIDGHIQRVGEAIFVFAPNGVQIEADLHRQWPD